ncbi:hypothetical protein NQ318_001897 [Aromia moschata]|uniref:Uncharacterized protein n=1 Tax=Aromia moschata TaxID=1265417 RepID=A0AAV8Z434_9CUCU|nr:hypothetical protein NQ318_001897 [Aromia moschata]
MLLPGRCERVVTKGRETTEDDPRPGRSSTSKPDENVEKIGIDKECVRQILDESFNMRKNGAKTPHSRAKGIKNEHLRYILNNIDTDPGLLDTVTLKGTRFESVEAVKAKATEVLNQLTDAEFQHCFQQWKSRMERYRDRQGEYI